MYVYDANMTIRRLYRRESWNWNESDFLEIFPIYL